MKPSSDARLDLYCGHLITPLAAGGILDEHDGALLVDSAGKIVFAGARAACPPAHTAQVHEHPDCLILPGFIDTHAHIPQFPLRAAWSGELLDWLHNLVFPFEAQFADIVLARRVARKFFTGALSEGTTCMAVFSSVHGASTSVCFEEAERAGIRALIGKSMMDMQVPADVMQSRVQNLQEMEELAARWHGLDDGRLQYCVTPRYAGSCTRELLIACADFARFHGLPIQSHLAENPAEIQFVCDLHQYARNYTEIYAQAGLLSERSIMAHAIYLTESELGQLAQTDTALAHCACSNRFLQSGVMGLREREDHDLRIGLGSDVAGGWTLSLINEMREAIESSKTWNFSHPGRERETLSPGEAFRLASYEGARVLGLEGVVGSLEEGKEADFLLCTVPETAGQFLASGPLRSSTEETLNALIYAPRITTIQSTFIRGSCVFCVK